MASSKAATRSSVHPSCRGIEDFLTPNELGLDCREIQRFHGLKAIFVVWVEQVVGLLVLGLATAVEQGGLSLGLLHGWRLCIRLLGCVDGLVEGSDGVTTRQTWGRGGSTCWSAPRRARLGTAFRFRKASSIWPSLLEWLVACDSVPPPDRKRIPELPPPQTCAGRIGCPSCRPPFRQTRSRPPRANRAANPRV